MWSGAHQSSARMSLKPTTTFDSSPCARIPSSSEKRPRCLIFSSTSVRVATTRERSVFSKSSSGSAGMKRRSVGTRSADSYHGPMSAPERKFATRCIHAGYRASPQSPAVVAPLVQSTTFLLDDASYRHMLEGRVDEALIYTRLGNPTLDVVQERLASLEGTEHALVFASGMAAIHAALLSSLPRGGSIVAHRELYGSSWDLMANQLAPYGIRLALADLDDPRPRAPPLAAPKPQVVSCESVSNPTLHVADLSAIAVEAHAVGAKLLVDATFASPALQPPAELGGDL